MNDLIVVLEQGLLFSLVAIGVYITYKILDFPDLSVDGSFPLGAAISAILLIKGVNPWLTVVVATVGGMAAGYVTGFLHVKLKISNLMSGILVMIALYSVNLRVMGKSNLSFFESKIIFNGNIKSVIIIAVIVLVIKVLMDLFMKTRLGMMLRAVGDNEQVVTSLGINKDNVKLLGLMISNGLVAMSGALTAQYQGFADVGMGTGMVVSALAAVIIGVSIFEKLTFVKLTSLSIFGAVIYKGAIAIALKMNLNPNDLKILTALLVVVALSVNTSNFKSKKKKKLTDNTKAKDGEEFDKIKEVV